MGYVTRAAALTLGVTLVAMPAFSGDRGEIRRAGSVTLKGGDIERGEQCNEQSSPSGALTPADADTAVPAS